MRVERTHRHVSVWICGRKVEVAVGILFHTSWWRRSICSRGWYGGTRIPWTRSTIGSSAWTILRNRWLFCTGITKYARGIYIRAECRGPWGIEFGYRSRDRWYKSFGFGIWCCIKTIWWGGSREMDELEAMGYGLYNDNTGDDRCVEFSLRWRSILNIRDGITFIFTPSRRIVADSGAVKRIWIIGWMTM